MYLNAAVVIVAAGSIVSTAAGQTAQPARVGGYGKIVSVRIGDRVIKSQAPATPRTPVVVYDNWPAANGYPFYFAGNRVLDKISLTPGPASGGPVMLTKMDMFGVAAPPSDPGGTFDVTFRFFDTVDEFAPAGSPVNTGPLGQPITVTATVAANPFGAAGGVVWLFTIEDITTAGITIPDDNFGVTQEVFVTGTRRP